MFSPNAARRASFGSRLRRACALLLLAATSSVAPPAPAQQATPPTPQPQGQKLDRARLEVIEDLSESLANDLLELSVAVRDRDAARTAEFFPARLTAAPFPSRPQAVKQSVKWIGTRGWGAAPRRPRTSPPRPSLSFLPAPSRPTEAERAHAARGVPARLLGFLSNFEESRTRASR